VICLILNTFILSKGIKGIEKVAKVGYAIINFLLEYGKRIDTWYLEHQKFS
jgi:hypothetical protein